MFNLLKKDFLTISKSKNDLLELLLMPFILMVILGFALGNVLTGDISIDTFNVGIVNDQNLEEDLSQLETTLQEEGISEEFETEIMAGAEQNTPATVLLDLMEHEDFAEVMEVESFESTEAADAALNEEAIEGYIQIPEDFSLNYWTAVYLEEDLQAELNVSVLSEDLVSGTILQSVVDTFADEYNLNTSIGIATEGQANLEEDAREHGELVYLSVEEPISAFQYYTIGMGVMFALSTAPAIASRAFREKQQHVFARIMLAGTKPMTYLMSKLISGTLITFIQLMILFILSTVIFGTFSNRSMEVWLNVIYTTGLYSLLVGSLSSLLTSTTLYSDNVTTVNFFGSFVSVFAFLGGSFTPVEQFSESLAQVGNWTPNGAAMTSYLQILQGFEFQEVMPLMIRVVGMTILFLVVAVVIFPKRRLD